MRRGILSVCLLAATCMWPLPIASQGVHPLDTLQMTQREETIDSLLRFMEKVWNLNAPTIRTLIDARLLNATLLFDVHDTSHSTQATLDASRSYHVSTGRDHWELSVREWRSPDEIGEDFGIYKMLTVRIVPSEKLRAWMKASEAYYTYSGEEIPDKWLKLSVLGCVHNALWKEEDRREVEGDDAPHWDFELELELDPYVSGMMYLDGDVRHRPCVFKSVSDFTDLLEDYTTNWVRYYMGKGDRPTYLGDRVGCRE